MENFLKRWSLQSLERDRIKNRCPIPIPTLIFHLLTEVDGALASDLPVSIRASCAFLFPRLVLQPSGLGVLDPPHLNPSASRPTWNLEVVWSELWLKRSGWSNAGFVRSIRNTWRACETPDGLVPLSGIPVLWVWVGDSLHFCLGDRT